MIHRCAKICYLVWVFLVLGWVSLGAYLLNDGDVLLRVKNDELRDPYGRLGDWVNTGGGSPCNWTGITCDSQSGAVVAIDLNGLGISGSFPGHFCWISTLRSLNLANNSLTGTLSAESLSLCSHLHILNVSSNAFVGGLPDFLTGFVNLTLLDFAENNFSGNIPESFGRFPALQVLSLAGNLLNGSIPEFLTNLTELTRFELAYNPFRPGPLPSTIGKLTNLKNLWLADSNLIGVIPDAIGNLTALTNLDLSANKLSGRVPDTIGGLRSVVQIELYRNQLSGGLPEVFSSLSSLRKFDASENKLTGSLPDSLAALPLESLNLNDNALEGEIPAILTSSPNLKQLKLFNNNFSGTLPVDLGRNSDLEDFDVSGNKFEGPLPPYLCYRKKLLHLVTFNNKFSGTIPESYGACNSLTYVRIFNNEFTGELPVRFWSFSGLNMLQLENNRFQGPIPSSISGARNLNKLLISGNSFSGPFPSEICGLQDLVVLDLSRNQFSGELASCVTKLNKLQKLDLQENAFTGEIPRSVRLWTELTELNLSRNKLSGEIPSSIGSLSSLTYLDLAGNLLSGEIPRELTNLNLNIFNLSNNRLEGRIPPGFNRELFLSSLMGNMGLCSPNLRPLPRCPKPKPKHNIYLIGVLCALAVLLSGSLIWHWHFKAGKLRALRSKSKRLLETTLFQQVGFDEEDLVASLTDENLIGNGASGRVYLVKLKTGQMAAVKKLWEDNRRAEANRMFWSEVETLGRIRHCNIVKLLFICVGENCRLLGYEYIENGSLADMLHGENRGVVLDWTTRLAIAVGAARGLAYLHHNCMPAIIHRDVKSNNILLDGDFRPRLADFGLATILTQDVHEDDRAMPRLTGSYGYIAPEHGYTLKVNNKSDVYSFGVVLLELITGKSPNDPSFGENKDIVKWAREAASSSGSIAADLSRLIDPRMNPPPTRNYEEVENVLNVALHCTSPLPINRPSMQRVVELLVKGHPSASTK